jgi:uncharacterized membrane protein
LTRTFLSKFSVTLAKLDAVHRLLIGLGFAIPSYFLLTWQGVKPVTGLMMSWDIFSLLMVTMMWIIFFNIPEASINLMAEREDDSRTVIFFIVLISVLISLLGIVILLRSSSQSLVNKNLHEPVSMIGVALSWFLLHTTFTIHYAHLYYNDDGQQQGVPNGIDFPGQNHPDYLDFAYFSFVIGMTFQVSDVSISIRKIRRLALLHGIVSFLFNSIIVALTISVIANLK